MKKSLKKEWHTPRSPVGSGDFYGTGIKQPIGKSIRSYMEVSSPKKSLNPPKKLA